MSATLGYVFWHWPRPGVSRRRYERKLLAFQDSLRAHGPEGLIEALSFRVQALPWARPRPGSCEDWYVVKDFRALGALNEAAVADANSAAHDDVAKDASGSVAGLYKRRQGNLRLDEARFATWIQRPARTTYQAFLERLSKLTEASKTDLWQRQMVLGPAPEFCLHSESRLDFPSGFRSTTVHVQLVRAKGDESATTDGQEVEVS